MSVENNILYNFIDGYNANGCSPYDIWRSLGDEGTSSEFLNF